MSLKKQFKNNLPAHLREHPNVDALFGAVGELLEEMKADIDSFQFAYDYEKIKDRNFDAFSEQMGVNYPRNLAQQNKKILIRDIISVYRAKGTEKAIKQLFKLVGWRVEIDYIWIQKGTHNKEFIYPSDYYFGVETVYEDGVYADVNDYLNQTYEKVQIVGEEYGQGASVSKFQLIKTPYIRVIVTAEDYKLFTQDFVDAEGNVYEFTETEKFEIVQEIFNFFFESGRPAHVAIIEIATPFRLDDDIEHTTSESSNLEALESEDTFFSEIGEYETVSINAPSSYSPNRIHFNSSFNEVPVVVAFTWSNNEASVAYARVANITKNRFDLFLEAQDDSSLNKFEDVTYIAMVPGVHELQNGLIVEAGTHSTSSAHRGGQSFGGDGIQFSGSFSEAPAVFSCPVTREANGFTATTVYDVSTDGFTIQQEKMETNTPIEEETLGWIAFSIGQYDIHRSKLTVGTIGGVGDVSTSVSFSNISFSDTPYLLAHGRTANDTDGYIIRSDNLDTNGMDLFAQEDTVGDSETGHSGEGVSYLAIEWTGPDDITNNRIYSEFTEELYQSSMDDSAALLDGTVTFDIPMTRYTNFGEYYSGFSFDNPQFDVHPAYPSVEYTGRIYQSAETGVKDVIPVSDDARLKISLGPDTTVLLYKVLDNRTTIAAKEENLVFVDEIYGPMDEFEIRVRYATGVVLNVNNYGKLYGFVYESSDGVEDYGSITSSSSKQTDLGLVAGVDSFGGFVHVLIGHHTDIVQENDFYSVFGEEHGSIEHHTDFYANHGSILSEAETTDDFGTLG